MEAQWIRVGMMLLMTPVFSSNHNINISGATESTQYYFSADYSNQNSFIKNNTFENYMTRLNIGHTVNDFIRVGANISYSNAKNVGPNTGAVCRKHTVYIDL